MDVQPTESEPAPKSAGPLGALRARRERMQSISAAQRERLASLEAQVVARLDQAAAALASEQEGVVALRAEHARQYAEVVQQAQELSRREAELAAQSAQLDRRATELEEHATAHADRAAQLEKRTMRLSTRDKELSERAATVEQELAAREAALELQLRNAQSQAAGLAQQEAELAARSATLDHDRQALLDRTAQIDKARAEHEAEFDRQTRQLAERTSRCSEREAEAEKLAATLSAAQKAAAERVATGDDTLRDYIAAYERLAEEAKAKTAQLASHEANLATLAAEYAARDADFTAREADLARQRDELASDQQAAAKRLAAVERTLSERQIELDLLVEQADQRAANSTARETEIVKLREAVAAEQAEIVNRAAELKRQCAEHRIELERTLAKRQAELDARATQLEAAESRLRQVEQALADAEQAGITERARLQTIAQQRLAALEAEQQALAADRTRTQAQRAHVAEMIRREREEQLRSLQERRSQLEDLVASGNSGQEALLADARGECQRLAEQLRARAEELASSAAAHEATRRDLAALKENVDEDIHSRHAAEARATKLAATLEQERQRTSELEQERDALQQELARLAATPPVAAPADAETAARLTAVSRERDDLARRLATAEAALAEPREELSQTNPEHERQIADLTQRYEMAVRDIRDLKKQNEELVKKAAAGAAVSAHAPGQAMDWEASKRQLLASLESDNDDSEERQNDRLEIEEVVRKTDEALVEKQREIDELKSKLGSADDSLGEFRAAAANREEIYDKDDGVQEERDRLRKLQEEWEGKLRQAEIDMSMQRAQIARARAELEERQRALDEQGAPQAGHAHSDGGNKSKKAPRGRWLSRLGLSEDENQK